MLEVAREAGRRGAANGTPSTRTPCSGHSSRRSRARTSNCQRPRSRWRQVDSTGWRLCRCGVEYSHSGQRSRRRRSATVTATRSAKRLDLPHPDPVQAQQARESRVDAHVVLPCELTDLGKPPACLTRTAARHLIRLGFRRHPCRRATTSRSAPPSRRSRKQLRPPALGTEVPAQAANPTRRRATSMPGAPHFRTHGGYTDTSPQTRAGTNAGPCAGTDAAPARRQQQAARRSRARTCSATKRGLPAARAEPGVVTTPQHRRSRAPANASAARPLVAEARPDLDVSVEKDELGQRVCRQR